MKLGDSRKADAKSNCLSCRHFSTCGDPKKHYRYSCSKWGPLAELAFSEDMTADALLIPSKKLKKTKTPPLVHANGDLLIDERKAKRSESKLLKMVDAALESEMALPPDFRIDDRDMPLANNIWEWINGKRFMNSPFNIYPRQFELAVRFCADWCPKCTKKGFWDKMRVDEDMGNVLDGVQLLHRGVCPKCKSTRSEMVNARLLQDATNLIAVVGQRSGKSFTTGVIETYQHHLWLRAVSSPQGMLSLPATQQLTGTYISMTFQQTLNNLFTPIRNSVKSAPWFTEYHEMLRDYEERTGENLYTINELFIRYRHRNLLFHVASSNKRSLRGATRIAAILDELGWFQNGNKSAELERASGKEVYDAMNNSLGTASGAYHTLTRQKGYNYLPKPYIAGISSPSDVNDQIMTLYRDGKGTDDSYCVKAATWEFNPNMPKTTPLIAAAFRRDPVGAMRDWGAEPPLSAAGWITEVNNVTPLFDPKLKNAVDLRQRRIKTRTGAYRMTADVTLKKTFNGGRVMVLDAARTNNSFALSVAHLDEETGVIVFDALAEVQPAAACPISFHAIYENVLKPIAQGLGVKVLVTDTWQNLKILEDLEADLGVIPFQQKLQYKDFVAAKDSCYDRKMRFPAIDMKGGVDAIFDKSSKRAHDDDEADTYPGKFLGKPSAHLFYQILSVRDYPAAKQVTKGPGVTDDIFRCVVLSHWALTTDGVLAVINGEEEDEEEIVFSPAVGAVRGRGNGAGGPRSSGIGYSAAMGAFGAGAAAPNKVAMRSDGGRGNMDIGPVSPVIGSSASKRS